MYSTSHTSSAFVICQEKNTNADPSVTSFLQRSATISSMCGRYGFSVTNVQEVYDRFAIANTLLDFQPRWNIAPGQLNLVITRHSPNKIERMFWGLIPQWAKDDSFKFKTINARAEGIEGKPVYKKPFRFQRCLVPATGFYEWDKSQTPSKPHYFHLKEQDLFAFAGLYDVWQDRDTGQAIRSYTIITTTANDLVGSIHPRMPVILKRMDEDTWLNPDLTEPADLLPLLKPFPSQEMVSYLVSPAVNNPRNDSSVNIQPV
jgi:putative SOS response-associated peptidase YedK